MTSQSKGLRLSFSSAFLRTEEGMKSSEKQGIGSILRASGDKHERPSLRRTFSADMSSRKWLQAQNLKKIPSQLSIINADNESSSSEEEEEHQVKRRKDLERTSQLDTWNSIQAKNEESNSAPLPPPYVHPLVKKKANSLSQKSLEICTESLGSETGSDGFFFDFEEDAEEEIKSKAGSERGEMRKVQVQLMRSPKRDLPPPLPSISPPEGSRMHMRTRREDGRLVVEAIPVPSQSCFRAERQDGRLLLTIARVPAVNANEEAELEDNEEAKAQLMDEIESLKRGKAIKDRQPEDDEVGVLGPRLVINKLINGIPLMNTNLSSSSHEKGTEVAEEEEQPIRVLTGRPSMPPPLAWASDSEEIGWKESSRATSPPTHLLSNRHMFVEGGCKEFTSRLPIWVPNCIATT